MRVMYIKPDEFQELPSYLSPPLFNAMFGSFTTVPAPKGNKNPESTPSWMDVAKSQDIPEPVAEAVPSYAPTTRVQQLTRNVLNSDVEVIGSLRFSDDLLIDGTVEGDISSEGVLSVGQNAVIRAEINTKSVIIHGKVIGNVTVTDRVQKIHSAESKSLVRDSPSTNRLAPKPIKTWQKQVNTAELNALSTKIIKF